MVTTSDTLLSDGDQEGLRELAEESNGVKDVDVPVVAVPSDRDGTTIVDEMVDGTSSSSGEHEAVGNGWVSLEAGERDDAVFMISGARLGIGPAGADSIPVWLDLDSIKNLDAIGDPIDGIVEIEIRMTDGNVTRAGWPESFCDVVVAALRATVESPPAPRTLLELEDVTYLGGFPGHAKRKKRCTATLSTKGIEISTGPDVKLGLAWDDVMSLDAQNSDEARFRTNTKIHRDASAIIIEPKEGDLVVLEARDCPTVALRQAIITLLKGVDVTVR